MKFNHNDLFGCPTAWLVKTGAIKLLGLSASTNAPIQKKEKNMSKQSPLVAAVKSFMSKGHSFDDAHALAELKLGKVQPDAQPSLGHGLGGILGNLLQSGELSRSRDFDSSALAKYTKFPHNILHNGLKDGVIKRVSRGVYRFV